LLRGLVKFLDGFGPVAAVEQRAAFVIQLAGLVLRIKPAHQQEQRKNTDRETISFHGHSQKTSLCGARS
jgi:hypothetical protein